MVPALGVAQTLQNRVGTTFSSLQLLSPPEQSAALIGAGATSIGTAVLNSIKEGQDKILEATNQVVSLIQTQVDIAEEQERRARDNLTELNKEKENDVPVGNVVPTDDGKFKLDKKGMLEDLDVGDFAAVATAGALLFKSVAGKILKGGAKGGFYGIMATFLAEPILEFIEDGILKIEIPPDDKKSIIRNVTAAAVGLGLAGIPGALIALGAMGVNSLIEYINGEKENLGVGDAVSLFAGGVGLKFLSSKATTALTAAGWTKAAGILGALTSTPVLIAIGIGLAIGIAINELVKFNEEVQKRTLKELEANLEISREELSKKFAEQKEGFLENLKMAGVANLFGFDISDLAKARIGTQQALDEFKDDPKEFDATEQASVLKSLDGILLADKGDLTTILSDKTKTDNMLDTINAARQLAVAGAFGPEKSKELLAKILKFGSNIQVVSQEMKNRGEGTFISKRLAGGEGDLLEIFQNEYMKNYNEFNRLDKLHKDAMAQYEKMEKIRESGEYDTFTDESKIGFDKVQSQLLLKATSLFAERNNALTNMQDFDITGLYKEGSLGFDPMKLKDIFTDDELNQLIKGALKNQLFDISSKNMADMAAMSDRQPGFDNITQVNSTSSSSSNTTHVSGEGDTTGIDKSLYVVHPIYGAG